MLCARVQLVREGFSDEEPQGSSRQLEDRGQLPERLGEGMSPGPQRGNKEKQDKPEEDSCVPP